MKLPISGAKLSSLLFILFFLASCGSQETETEIEPPAEPVASLQQVEKQNQLPVQYQTPSYMVAAGNAEDLDEGATDAVMKVGASIRSTQGPQPLWDILKRLAALKKMNVSWASDVDQSVLVDVDISADDDFYAAIDNLLRQVDYYHEMQGSTIVVHYKETRQFHVAMPFTKSLFETGTGGNVLGSNDAASNIEGTIRLDSRGNEFNIWQNIQDNIDAILDTWSTSTTTQAPVGEESADGEITVAASRQISSSGNRYTIDKPIGLVTVHAPRPLLDKLEVYFTSLKRELYKQVSIEAKIIEVQLEDHKAVGLNWNLLLRSLSMPGGGYNFNRSRSRTSTRENTFEEHYIPTRGRGDFLPTGVSGESYRWNEGTNSYDRITTPNTVSVSNEFDTDTGSQTNFPSLGVATVLTNAASSVGGAALSMAAFTFDSFLNAVKEQGQTTILSNPKISVLNGQPALITVGRNVTYIDAVDNDINADTGTVSYKVATQRILSGVGMALTANILDGKEIILNLVPVTSELMEPIEYRDFGGGTVGLPIVNVREMSTTVKVRDGEMLVIGGLISDVEEDGGTFVPGTSDIPFFKYFFGYEEKTSRKRELIILLRPRIL